MHTDKKYNNKSKSSRPIESTVHDTKLLPDAVRDFFQKYFFATNKTTTVNILLTLAILIISVYANSVTGAFVSDDIPIISQSKTIGTLTDVIAKPYVFLRIFLYIIIYTIFGANPIYFHLLNIGFHIGSVCILFFILKKLLNKRVAFFACVLFSVHPIISESVSWISGGGYPQYSFFVLLSFLFFISSSNSIRQYTYSIIAFVFALFSSDKALMYPGILIIYLLSTSSVLKKWKKLIPFVALSLIWSVFYYLQLTSRVQSHSFSFGNTHYITNPFLFVATIISSYIRLLFWPNVLTIFHSEFALNWQNNTINIAIFILFITSVLVSYFKNRKLFFWLMFFPISLGITLLPLRISWIVAERYVYLGSIGVFVVVSILMNYCIEKGKGIRIIYSLFIVVIILLSIRTIVRNTEWRNEEKLWSSTIKTTPSNPVAHSSLGIVYRDQGDLEKAGAEFYKSVSLNPQYAEGYYNLADLYRLTNNYERAKHFYQKSISLNPDLWQAYQALGAVYYLQQKYAPAIENTKKAITLQKNNAELYINLGIMFYDSGDKMQAQAAFQKALEIEPDNIKAQSGLQKIFNGMQ